MALVQCGECSASISTDAAACPKCGCRSPFRCAVCGRRLREGSSYPRATYDLCKPVVGPDDPDEKRLHPYGLSSKEGLPLCENHGFTRCDKCGHVAPANEMRLVEKWRALCSTCSPFEPPIAPEQPKRTSSSCLALLMVGAGGIGVQNYCFGS